MEIRREFHQFPNAINVLSTIFLETLTINIIKEGYCENGR
jgi:hypothetical protein